jgi:hypothetical protein
MRTEDGDLKQEKNNVPWTTGIPCAPVPPIMNILLAWKLAISAFSQCRCFVPQDHCQYARKTLLDLELILQIVRPASNDASFRKSADAGLIMYSLLSYNSRSVILPTRPSQHFRRRCGGSKPSLSPGVTPLNERMFNIQTLSAAT